MDEEQLQELMEKVPGIGDFLVTLNATQWESEKDALAVAEAIGSFLAAIHQGKPLRPEYLH